MASGAADVHAADVQPFAWWVHATLRLDCQDGRLPVTDRPIGDVTASQADFGRWVWPVALLVIGIRVVVSFDDAARRRRLAA
ncbi:hypothetical protein GCM10027074_13410 [Streptomyces deserti]